MSDTPVGRLPTLAEVRHQRALTQRQLAAMAWMRPSAIGAIEAGHTRVFDGWKTRIASALGVEPDAIDWTRSK